MTFSELVGRILHMVQVNRLGLGWGLEMEKSLLHTSWPYLRKFDPVVRLEESGFGTAAPSGLSVKLLPPLWFYSTA